MNLQPVWTDKRVAALRQLASEKFSASQIGAALGVTRNAVIAKMRRMGIPLAGFACGQDWRQKFEPSTPRPAPRPRKPKVRRAAALRARFDVVATEATDLPSEPTTAGEHITGAAAAVFALTRDSCRWPSDDDHTSPDFHFCMRIKLDASPYCREHHRIAYKPSVDRQRRAA